VTAENDFLRAIHDEPDEPAHRLVFADWLEENGDPARAECVRVEVKLDALGDRAFEGEMLRAYSEFLYVAHGDRLRAAVKSRYGKTEFRTRFGVPDAVHVEPAEAAAGDEAALAPPLRRLTVVSKGSGAALLSRPELAGVSDLEVRGMGPAEFDALFARPLPRLRALNLVHPRLDRARRDRLFDAPLMQQLTELTLSGDVADLLRRPRPQSLRRLRLHHVDLDAAATEALFGAAWAGLQRLDLEAVTVDEPAAARMLQGDGLGSVEGLRLYECEGIGPPAIAALLSNRTLARLRAVTFTASRYAAKMPVEILASADLPALEHLDLWQTRFEAGAGAALGCSALAPRLRRLRLGRCGLSRDDTAVLFAGDFRRLEWLDLEGARVTGGGRGALLSAAWLPGLKHLELDWCPLKPADGRALARCAALSGLRFLGLSVCKGLGDDGLLPIVRSPHLARLEILHADATNSTATLARALAAAPMRSSLRLARLDPEPLHAAVGLLGESAHHETFRSLYWDRGMP
jgi:uncharacterized protein (TIGR02996 family)